MPGDGVDYQQALRAHLADFHGKCPWEGEDHQALLDRALASERRATVEPTVRATLYYIDHHTPLSVGEPLVQKVLAAILDEEAARSVEPKAKR